jgi:ATP-dependent Clp protease ATP-binding subunit ClpX
VENIANFQAYGFLPELMARFTRIVPFRALDPPTLKDILRGNVIDRLTREFEDEGFKLTVTEDVLDHVVGESIRRETGARGLAAILTRHLETAAFDVFAELPGGEVRLELKSGEIEVRVG